MDVKKCVFDSFREVYTYYDGPLSFLFTQKDEDGLFYGHLIDTDDAGDVFWVVKVTEDQVKQAEQGEVNLRTFMTTPASLEDEVSIVKSDGTMQTLSLKEAVETYAGGLPRLDSLLID